MAQATVQRMLRRVVGQNFPVEFPEESPLVVSCADAVGFRRDSRKVVCRKRTC